jgi:serine/threonine protein kinase/Tol biopolymer transport system component
MALVRGTRLGPYEIIAPLGVGGMGEVYRARDTSLARDVAVKVLPDTFAKDPERLARFKREAQTLAALSHANIAIIYSFEASNGVQTLVMELVEGPTLADRIARGPIPLLEALRIAQQMTEALEAAHEHGIVHRDLKPANIKVRPDGTVKVLDFGLAKAIAPEAASAVSLSLTNSSPLGTRLGVVLGTASYMAPEQARGHPVDKRADIWAFGAVLFEMLTARPAFPGVDVSEIIAAVIKSDIAWNLLPETTPSKLRGLLRRCLAKDPRQRIRDIGDVRIEVEELLSAPHGEPPAGSRSPIRQWVPWALATITAALALSLGFAYLRPQSPAAPAYRSAIILPTAASAAGTVPVPPARFSLSADGRRLAFVALSSSGVTQLWVQRLDADSGEPLAGTEGAAAPFWSPDSRFIGFYAGASLKKIDTAGGPPLTLAPTTGNAGATWNRDNTILFSTTGRGSVIRRISGNGGAVTAATSLDQARGETQHWNPSFLPDGRHFLYLAVGSTSGGPNDPNGIYVAALDATVRKLLIPGGSNARYAQGYLFYLREQTLMAQPFDVNRLELVGDPTVLAQGIATGGLSGRTGAFSVSDSSVVAYQRGPAVDVSQLVWLDRTGKQLSVVSDQNDYGDLELSPDGALASISRFDPRTRTRDLWLLDLRRTNSRPFTLDPADEFASVWSPDGSRIVFNSARKGNFDLYLKTVSGDSEEVLATEGLEETPWSWSRDGRFILYSRATAATGESLWVLPLVGHGKPTPVVETPSRVRAAQFSPDGRWIAYVSDERGRNEVYVASFPRSGGKWQVSTDGGDWPRWHPEGTELFYLAPGNRLMAAMVNRRANGFDVNAARLLFETPARSNRRSPYDVSADGQQFLFNLIVGEIALQPIHLVVNWPSLVTR